MKKNNSIKTLVVFAVLMNLSNILYSQTYTWMKGSNTVDQQGTYGQIGIAAGTNNPGARETACSWKDASGNFWMFGGLGYDAIGNYGYLNDLWKYTVSTNEWTWIAGDDQVDQDGVYGTIGTPAAANKPGSRTFAVAWTDASGNFWLFGGEGYDAFSSSGMLNDLWRYNPVTNQWTWMKGSNSVFSSPSYGTLGVSAASNNPGVRMAPNAWVGNSGDLFLFGGLGEDGFTNYGDLNDLWKYNITSNQWTWINGSNTADQNGVYGTQGIAAATNQPGARYASQMWKDPSGNLWMQGGYGYDLSSTLDEFLNDIWKYNPATNQWTWMMGSTTAGQLGTYGTLGIPASNNIPGARAGGLSWTDSNGNIYMFGGTGYLSSTMNTDDLNDLWKFSTLTNQWTWMKGSNQFSQNGIYGTQGVAAPANSPGSRFLSVGWIDNTDKLWIFGGIGIAAGPTSYGDLDDLWKLEFCIPPTINITSNTSTICVGQSNTLTASGANTYTWSTLQTGASLTISPQVTTSYSVIGTDASGCSASFSYTQIVTAGPTLAIALSSSTNGGLCSGQSGTLIASGNGITTYSWSTGVSSTSIVVAPTTMTSYVGYGINANGCIGTSTITIPVFQNPVLTVSSTKSVICKGETAILQAGSGVTFTWSTVPPTVSNTLLISPTITTSYSVTGSDAMGCKGISQIFQTVDMCTGLQNFSSNESHITLYPNPNKGSFSFTGINSEENTSLVIFNALGQKVLEYIKISSTKEIETGLPAGLYHFHIIQNNKKLSSGKLLVE